VPESNSRLAKLAAADAYFRGFETNGTSDYIPAPLAPRLHWRENGVLYTNTKIGASMLSTARSGFDAGQYNGMVRDRRYPVVDSSVRRGDELGALRRPVGAAQQGLTAVQPVGQAATGAGCDGRCFVRQRDSCGVVGKIAEISAHWIPTEGNVQTPRAVGTVAVRAWQSKVMRVYDHFLVVQGHEDAERLRVVK
jgi:hypothetical protein